MKELWYKAYAYYKVDGRENGMDEYFCINVEDANNAEQMKAADEEAIRMAKEWADEGEDFSDIGHVALDLVEVCEVDGDKECFPEIRQVWY